MFLEDGQPLYVGMGENALARASQAKHHKAYIRESADEIRIWPCVSLEAAKELETLLLGRLRPRFNSNNLTGYVRELLGVKRTPAHVTN